MWFKNEKSIRDTKFEIVEAILEKRLPELNDILSQVFDATCTAKSVVHKESGNEHFATEITAVLGYVVTPIQEYIDSAVNERNIDILKEKLQTSERAAKSIVERRFAPTDEELAAYPKLKEAWDELQHQRRIAPPKDHPAFVATQQLRQQLKGGK